MSNRSRLRLSVEEGKAPPGFLGEVIEAVGKRSVHGDGDDSTAWNLSLDFASPAEAFDAAATTIFDAIEDTAHKYRSLQLDYGVVAIVSAMDLVSDRPDPDPVAGQYTIVVPVDVFKASAVSAQQVVTVGGYVLASFDLSDLRPNEKIATSKEEDDSGIFYGPAFPLTPSPSPAGDPRPVATVIIDPVVVDPQDVAILVRSLSRAYESVGGDPLEIEDGGTFEVEDARVPA